MINFHLEPDMFVARPKLQLAHYKDLTMPRRDWRKYDLPTSEREFLAPRFREQREPQPLPPMQSILQAG